MSRVQMFLSGVVVELAVIIMLLCGALPTTVGQVAAAGSSTAATSSSASGLKIAPTRNDITIEKGASQTITLTIQNVTSSPVTLSSVVNDFVANPDESGQPRLLLDDTQLTSGNNFKLLIGSIPSITLAPNESRQVPITLNVPFNAASGGYYGAVRFAPSSDVTSSDIALSGSVGTIFLIRVPGDIVEKLTVESFQVLHDNKTGSLYSSGPIVVESRFHNLGNIHVQPFGKISLKNFSGKVIDQVELNNTQPRGSVLPDSIRKFDNAINQTRLFGRYTVEGDFGYGTTGQVLLAKTTFWVIPFKPIIAIIAAMIFVFYILPRIIRAYRTRRSNAKPKTMPKQK